MNNWGGLNPLRGPSAAPTAPGRTITELPQQGKATTASFNRRGTVDDVEHIRWALYTAVSWDPKRQLPPLGVALEHSQALRYHRDWGRPGDIAVVAELDGEIAGVAYCRLFTDADHGHDYVDDETPEVAVAVREGRRGRGLGARLMNELAQAALAAGFSRLSLSVDADNPARSLDERLGYREL
jgi:GNAT superfamily N-acetyltransferase